MDLKNFKNNLFKQNFFVSGPNLKTMGIFRSGMRVDPNTEYVFNNFGYRDKDWIDVPEILAVGCSNTFGVGIPESTTWPKILETNINSKISNLSFPGASIPGLVMKIFLFCQIIGKPQKIICLFPDPYRLKIPSNDFKNNDEIIDVHFNENDNLQKYSKFPHNYKDVVPSEVALFLNINHIYMLEQYCKSNNIKLIWATWYRPFNDDIQTISNDFNNYVYDQDFLPFEKDSNILKCNDLICKNYKEKFKEYFDNGLDVEDNEPCHQGVHQNIHIAKAFERIIKNDNTWN